MLRLVLAIVFAAHLVACNGSGSSASSSGTDPAPSIPAPSVAYASAALALTTGVPMETLAPSNSGGPVVSWSVSPTLPAGLTFSTADGSVSGSPMAEVPPVTYVVTAENAGGRSSASLTISVGSVLIELGNAEPIGVVRFSGARALSVASHWVLWDYATGASIAIGATLSGTPDLAGPTVVIPTAANGADLGFEVRASSDGRVLSSFPARYFWWKLAADGSYLCAGSERGLWAWSPNGRLLFSRAGDYSTAKVYAAPGEIRMALGPSGPGVVETISADTGASSVSPPFLGQFHSWFVDGERFLSVLSTTVWTYSKSAVRHDTTVLPSMQNLTGQGNWFWTHQRGSGNALDIYAVGTSSQPAATYITSPETVAAPSALTIGLVGPSSLGIIDLSGAAVSRSDPALPPCGGCDSSRYAALSSSRWLISRRAVLLDGASLSSGEPRTFGIGAALSIAGGGGRVAIATDSGRILVVNVQTKGVEATINAFSNRMEMSSDGAVLYAAVDPNFSPDRSIKVFALPSGTEINRVPIGNATYVALADMALADSGTTFGQLLIDGGNAGHNYRHEVTTALGGSLIWSDSGASNNSDRSYDILPPLRLSPDGTLIATSIGANAPTAQTAIVRGGNIVATVPGLAVGWIDNGRLLVDTWAFGRNSLVTYTGSTIYDPAGAKLAAPGLPALPTFQRVGPDSIYAPALNSILSVTTAAASWTTRKVSPRGLGVVVGPHVVFVSRTGVLSESYR